MNVRNLKVGVAIVLALAAGGFGCRLAIAGVSDVAPSAPTASTSSPSDPEAGLTDSQKDAAHKQQWAAFDQQYTGWVNALRVDQLNLHSLARSPLNAEWSPGQPTLHDAVSTADLIVVGTVTSIHPTAYSGTPTTFSVDQTLKGSPSSTIEVTQAGGLRPTDNWAGVQIVEGENGALLLPGDRAILLLQKTKLGYEIQSVSGWYQVFGGLVHSNSLNVWRSSVDGSTEAAFIQLLKTAVQ